MSNPEAWALDKPRSIYGYLNEVANTVGKNAFKNLQGMAQQPDRMVI